MPELKMCPACCIKHEVNLVYEAHSDHMVVDPNKLVYDTKFLCLKCDRIYQNTKPIYNFFTIDLAFPFNKISPAPKTPYDDSFKLASNTLNSKEFQISLQEQWPEYFTDSKSPIVNKIRKMT